MSDIPAGDLQRGALLKRIEGNLKTTEDHIRALRTRNSRFIYTSLFSSGIATIIAGQATAFGPLATGPGGWRFTCGIVAICTACATIFTALHKQFTIPELLAKATLCAGKLNALLLALTVTNRDTLEVAKEYEEIVENYRDFLV